MGLAFWENGCTTLPFFEPCPYTWKREISIPHGTWRFRFFPNFFVAKIKVHQDLHIHYWDFYLMKK
jgi:hypothetical protein